MRERVLAIVNLITQYVISSDDFSITEQELIRELLAAGFEQEEIQDAFAWMEKLTTTPVPSSDRPQLLSPASSYRIYSDEEQSALSLEAQGFLTRVRALGVMDDSTLEEVVEQAVEIAEEPLSLREISLLTSLTLVGRSHQLWLREIGCLIENDWQRLYH